MDGNSQLGSRERMIEAAITLMRGSGLGGAGINEIVRVSGSPKGSVYHFFPQGKLQITTEALAVYSTRVMAFIDQSLASKRQPGAKVKALFSAFARRVEEGDFYQSCAVGTVSLELQFGPRTENSSASGLARASTFLTGRPCTTLRTASSTILPLLVRGMSATCRTLAGTWRGVVFWRICCGCGRPALRRGSSPHAA
jgi:AcrR family transcriptional regulator